MRYAVCLLTIVLLSACVHTRTPKVNDLAVAAVNEWRPMLEATTLNNWNPFTETEYETGGDVKVQENRIELGSGTPFSAVNWTGTFPRSNYEVSMDARRTKGGDIFCGILFPVGESYCSMVLGGWGNTIVGLSCVDDRVAADNETSTMISFKNDTWYDVRLKVTDQKIEAWIDEKQVINLELKEHTISPYPGLEIFAPFGLFTFDSAADFRELYMCRLQDK